MGAYEGKRVLVTGASSGIGAGLAERFAAEGAVVGLVARREDRLREVQERCEASTPGARAWTADLSVPAEVDRIAAAALDELGGVDVCVNNAGQPLRRHVTRLDMETVDRVMALNYSWPVRLTLALLPHMLERRSGTFVNLSSVAAPLSSPGEAAYDASKAALTSFSECLATDLWDEGIRVLIVYPAVIDTELFTIPGNDPLPPGIDALPVGDLVDGVFDALAGDAVEVYVPPFFKDLVIGRVQDVRGFMAGTAEYIRTNKAGEA
jgi:NAD(P)-dependent dehydrogenase (short-subunit alcohol dehydrogenase family)